MKSVTLLRHAKSSWDDPSLDDFDRPLNERGREAAKRMGEEMRRLELAIDLALVSSAARAAETFELVLGQWGADVQWKVEPRLYLASPDEMLAIIAAVANDVERLVVVGHNPGMYQLALLLSAGDESQARRRAAAKYPTGALAEISLPIDDWKDVRESEGRLVRFLRPRDL